MSRASLQGVAPPELPGYRFLTHIGSGGNAQVYLYEQELPSRKVAVKVLNDSALSEAARRRFVAEANVTAVLAHRHIVQVFDAKVTDDGQPYIVMPFYPQPNLAVRARRAHFSVPQVLRIGIQIGSAVETSHRNGVLHRDIKPQNILTDSYGEPALTDFGIATTTAGDGPEGLSVPWSPPEIIYGTGPGDQRSDVYSLGATLWHLLVGRPPFEQPGGGNTTGELMDRIISDPPPRTKRPDVPDSLERLLRLAMAKDQAARPQSAMELIRGLQSIEQELRLPVTHPILPADEPVRGDTRGDTVARPAANGGGSAASREQDPVVTDSPQADGAQPAGSAEDTGGSGAEDASRRTRPDEPSHGQTVRRSSDQRVPPASEQSAESASDQSVWKEQSEPHGTRGEQSQPYGSSDTADATIARGEQPDAPWQPAADASRDDATRARLDAAQSSVHGGSTAGTAQAGENTVTRGRTPVRLDPWGGAGHQGAGAQVLGARPRQLPVERPDAATVARSEAGRFSSAATAGTDAVDAGDTDVATRQEGARSRRALAFAGGGVLLAVVAAVVVTVLAQGGGSPGTPSAGAGQATSQGIADGATDSAPPAPGQPAVRARRVSARQVEFFWTYANPVSGDTFYWQESGQAGTAANKVTRPDLLIAAVKGENVCLVVTASHADGATSPPSSKVCRST